MNTETITSNHDPELSSSETTRGRGDEDYRGTCRLGYWYLAPLTSELCHSLKCFLFHPISFTVCIFIFTFDVTMIAVGIGLIPLCCVGLPLLWLSLECIIVLSRIDLGLHYHLVQTSARLDASKAHLVQLSLYLTDVPLCCCYNLYRENCFNLMIQRSKYLFTNLEVYKYVLFQALARPIICCLTWWIMIVVAVNIGLLGIPFWYLANEQKFVNNGVVILWAEGCEWMHDDGVACPENYVFIINTFGRALMVAVIALVVLPLTVRINNYFAYLNKVAAYTFYTFYYSTEEIESSSPIFRTRQKVNSV
eukprot:437972_1